MRRIKTLISKLFKISVNVTLSVLLSLVVWLLGAVQHKKWKNEFLYIDPEFKTYTDQFRKDATKYNVHVKFYEISIEFSPSSITAVGICLPHLKSIYINSQEWEVLSDNARKILIYHELGHCALRKQHQEFVDLNFCPFSIMYPYIESIEKCYPIYENSYIKELFSNLPKN